MPQWALWIAGAVTLLALAILVFSIVLGVRAGQEQYAIRSRQQIGIALQAAVDYQQMGQLQAALDEYQKVMQLDPNNEAARNGIDTLLALAGNAPAVVGASTAPADTVATAPSAEVAGGSSELLRPNTVFATTDASTLPLTNTTSGLTPVAPGSSAGTPTDLMTQAQNAIRAGRWQEAVNALTTLRSQPQGATNTEVANLLFEAYVNLAAEKDNEENLEGALTYYDRALELRPDAATVRNERNLVDQYLEVLTWYDVDWEKSVALLTALYALDPQYRDVEERLQESLVDFALDLNADGSFCDALAQLETAQSVGVASTLPTNFAQLISDTRSACTTGEAVGALVPNAADPLGATTGSTTTAAAPAQSLRTPTGAPAGGRILYSARDIVDGRNLVFSQPVDGSAAAVVVEDAAQPDMRADGVRIAYRNTRSDQGGISASDPATGVFFRITDYPEDVQPSWDPTGGRVVFASNREGDRRWRIYAAWGEQGGAVETLSFGESPAWHPTGDQIVHRGCDDSGNNCGLWLMNSAGGNRHALTTVAGDNRPAWAPDGRSVVFMSDRDGGQDIYRVDVATGQVTRLTDSPALDAVPTVSPDGQWVAFLSNREGGWKLWAVPLAGGQDRLIAALKGDAGDWSGQGIQWVQ